MRHFIAISRTGLAAVRLHPLRSLVSVAALAAVIVPYLVGTALAKSLEADAETSLALGADLFVTGTRFGRPAPLPIEAVEQIGKLDGVTRVVPQIVGDVELGKDRVRCVVIGISTEAARAWATSVDGELPASGSHEVVVGAGLARRLGLKVGSQLPPFYRNDREGERLTRVVGVFKADAPLWQANVMLTSFETAAVIFDQRGAATDILVSCAGDKRDDVRRAIQQSLSFTSPDGKDVTRARATTRAELAATLPGGIVQREGIFSLHFVLAVVVAILVLLVTSGVGLTERRREIGILKATGWQTDEILLRGFVESFTLSVTGALIALVLAWLWLRLGNGIGIAGYFLAGADAVPDVPVPFRLTPVPALLAFVLSLVIVLTGTMWSAWRAAIVPPRVAMR